MATKTKQKTVRCRLAEMMAERSDLATEGKEELSIWRVAEDTGVSYPTIYALYHNATARAASPVEGIRFDTLAKLCAFFDCEPGDLLVIE